MKPYWWDKPDYLFSVSDDEKSQCFKDGEEKGSYRLRKLLVKQCRDREFTNSQAKDYAARHLNSYMTGNS